MEARTAGEGRFDHYSEDYARRWPELTAELRERCPVAHTDAHGGYWVVTGHPEVMTVVLDTDRYMNGRRNGESSTYIPGSMPLRIVPVETDPPLQTQVRRQLNPIFSDRMAAEWHPFIEAVTDVHLDAIAERGEGDLVLQVARQVTAVVNLALAGVPSFDEVDAFIDAPGITLRADPDSEAYKNAVAVTERVNVLFAEALDDRRRHPRSDLMTVIAHMELDPTPSGLSDEEFRLRLVQSIVAGGNSTTTSLIGHAFIHLSEHPDLRTRIAREPALLDEFLEEMVRLCTPAGNFGRVAREPGELAGQAIQPGERVLLSYAAANRDPRVFEQPDEVVFGREEKRHLGYGWGRHRCLGRSFARQMAKTIVWRVMERLPDFRVDLDGIERFDRIPMVNGLVRVPATFTPGRRTGATMPQDPPPLPDRVAPLTGHATRE